MCGSSRTFRREHKLAENANAVLLLLSNGSDLLFSDLLLADHKKYTEGPP